MRKLKYLLLFLVMLFFTAIPLQAQAYRLDVMRGIEHPPKSVKMPAYPTGSDEMMKFIEKFLIYPKDALKKKIEGRVVVQFIVSKKGNIQSIKVVRGLSPSCDKEAVRIISIMPKWSPGEVDGKVADLKYTLPILFSFSKSEETSHISVVCDGLSVRE